MEERKFIKEIHKTLKKQVLNEYVDKNLIKNAIENKRVIQIFYKGDETQKAGYRTIEPYLLGVTDGTTGGGNVAVRAWQRAGDTDSGSGIISNRWRARKPNHNKFDRDKMPGWRLFRIDGIKQMIPLSTKFAKDGNLRPDYNPNDEGMTRIFARVNFGDEAPYDEFGKGSIDDPNVTVTQDGDFRNDAAWERFHKEPENEVEKIKERIGQFQKVIMKKRKEKLKNYVLMKDRKMNDYKIVSQEAATKNFRGKYPPEDIIGNMKELVDDYLVGTKPIDTSLFSNAERDVQQASDKKQKELNNN